MATKSGGGYSAEQIGSWPSVDGARKRSDAAKRLHFLGKLLGVIIP
ncbi:MAG TPA: hypothetical protein VMT22_04495 [Terriglobales bacterium]|nr:hypothetical protein [Terriglobales bacterium]